MSFPDIKNISAKRLSITSFSGINLSNGTPPGEWEELENMCFSDYPALCTCKPLRSTMLPNGTTGYTWRGSELVYTVSDGIYIGGKKVNVTLSDGKKQLVSIGAYVVILPDWIAVNTADSSVKYSGTNNGSISGGVTEANTNITHPYVSIFKTLYMDVAEGDERLADFAADDKVILSWRYKNKDFSRTLKIKSIGVEDYTNKGYVSIVFDTSSMPDTTYNYLYDSPFTGAYAHINDAVATKCSSVIKNLDFVIEHNNRLWGCSSANHEIYCSKLGEPLVWDEYDGISTDSWAATIGTDGDFTGAAVYCDSVLFFKENCVHIVYGTKASNFTVSTIKLRGVQKGSENSLCISNGLLYYKAAEGIYAFNGSAAVKVDARLGDDIALTACGTADDRQIIMIMSDGKARCYDYVHDGWYTRTVGNAVSAHNISGKLYAVTESGGRYKKVQLSGSKDSSLSVESPVGFKAVTGWLGRAEIYSYFKKLKFLIAERHQYPLSSSNVKIEIIADGGEWQTVYEQSTAEDRQTDEHELVISPIIPLRCQRLKIRLSGTLSCSDSAAVQAAVTLHGIYITCEEGSEIGGKH